MRHRRTLVLLPLLIACCCNSAADAEQLIAIRFYHLRSAEFAQKFDTMMEEAVLPVMKKQNIGPVGVFKVLDSPELGEHARVVIAPYESFQQLLDLRKSFGQDPDFFPKAQAFLMQERGNPAYERVESMLLQAFSGMPELKVPGSGEGKERRFELRTYKSENEMQAYLKVQMFNEGEIDLFKRVGLNAVFYGDALVASNLPQLTYMLVHEDEEAQQQAWKTFIEHPDWKALSGEEQYQIIKLQITKHMLTATHYSQIR